MRLLTARAVITGPPPPAHGPGMPHETIHCLFASEGVPDWVRIMPLGTFRPSDAADKRGPWTLSNPAAVIEASMAGGDLVVDENHLTHAGGAQSAPARGWIKELQVRADGIYGRIEWTPDGQKMMADKVYRGFSPTFIGGSSGTVVRIVGLALTNNPALTELKLLTSQQETEMDLVQLRAALGLPGAADEAAILAAIAANSQAAAAATLQLTAVTTAAGLAVGASPESVVTALTALRAGAGDVQALTTQVTSLSGQLATLQAGVAHGKAVAFVDGQIAAGKPIVPLRDMYIRRHQENPGEVEQMLAALPSINAGGIVVAPPAGGGGGAQHLTAEDRQVIALMGVPVDKFIAERGRVAALRASGNGSEV